MTLYLLFEQIEAGKLKLDSRLPVSEHAAAQSPTKLELRAGQTTAVAVGPVWPVVFKDERDVAAGAPLAHGVHGEANLPVEAGQGSRTPVRSLSR